MKSIIIYDSLTGNTEELAEVIKEELKDAYYEKISDKLITEVPEGDIYYVGTPIIKGMCTERIKCLLEKLENKKVFLFATAGFGESKEYFDNLEKRIENIIPKSTKIIGTFFCQGKMKDQVKDKYIQLIREHPEDKKLQISLQNFEQAKKHPDDSDKENLRKQIKNNLDIK